MKAIVSKAGLRVPPRVRVYSYANSSDGCEPMRLFQKRKGNSTVTSATLSACPFLKSALNSECSTCQVGRFMSHTDKDLPLSLSLSCHLSSNTFHLLFPDHFLRGQPDPAGAEGTGQPPSLFVTPLSSASVHVSPKCVSWRRGER